MKGGALFRLRRLQPFLKLVTLSAAAPLNTVVILSAASAALADAESKDLLFAGAAEGSFPNPTNSRSFVGLKPSSG